MRPSGAVKTPIPAWFSCALIAMSSAPLIALAGEISFRVQDKTLHTLSPRLFGQFLERASFGESGPESVVDPLNGNLPSNAVEKLMAMRIPVVRFPGGTDVDHIDWTDMIDNVPGRNGARPITKVGANTISNRFGYDEYFRLRDKLGCETVIVLNLLDVVSKRVPLDAAALRAAGLVAYCNAQVGAKLPDGMPDWPSVRARNGHPKPFHAEYFQIGNEWRFFPRPPGVREKTGLSDKDALANWYIEVLHALIRAIRVVDPDVKLIVDGRMGSGIESIVLKDPDIRDAVKYVAFHIYAPGPADTVRTEGKLSDPASLTVSDWWYACASMPGELSRGVNVGLGKQIDFARGLGYQAVCTEWNWNGWGFGKAPPQFVSELLPAAQGLGAAGFLHGLMRQGDAVVLATQSMLLGHSWGITAVRVDPSGRVPPYYLPQGLATLFYSVHHGDRLLAVESDPLAGQLQPHVIGRWTQFPASTPTVAYVDLLVTADDTRVFVHAINRRMDDAQDIAVDLTALKTGITRATHFRYLARTAAERETEATPQECRIVREDVEIKSGVLRTQLRPHSVSIVEIARGRPGSAPRE